MAKHGAPLSRRSPSFNTLFKGNSTRATLEWRFVIRDEKPVPFAMIARYFTKSDTKRGQVLVDHARDR